MCSDRNELMQKKTREKMGFSRHRLLPKFTHVLFLLRLFYRRPILFYLRTWHRSTRAALRGYQ